MPRSCFDALISDVIDDPAIEPVLSSTSASSRPKAAVCAVAAPLTVTEPMPSTPSRVGATRGGTGHLHGAGHAARRRIGNDGNGCGGAQKPRQRHAGFAAEVRPEQVDAVGGGATRREVVRHHQNSVVERHLQTRLHQPDARQVDRESDHRHQRHCQQPGHERDRSTSPESRRYHGRFPAIIADSVPSRGWHSAYDSNRRRAGAGPSDWR